jgi:wyosine [tRNA(Phe)-imidazoG37] synthetase (radical SAM superfamily)
MKHVEDPLNQIPKSGSLIPYYFSGSGEPALYNSIQISQSRKKKGKPPVVLSASTFRVPDLPPETKDVGAGDLIDK